MDPKWGLGSWLVVVQPLLLVGVGLFVSSVAVTVYL